ncbi:MAG: TFIIB-type zinc ribbon-containing protein [Eubacteriales bacterium]
MEISIPTDDEGYVLLKCSKCGSYFKITPTDYEDNKLLFIYCPSCGLSSDNYITEDVLELAIAMIKNVEVELIYSEMKKWERQLSNEMVTFKVGRKPSQEPENPIRSSIEALVIKHFRCCNRDAKIKPMLKFTGCYCPFCGVKEYEVECD